MLKKLDDKLGPDDLAEIIGMCATSKAAKEKLLRQPTAKKEKIKTAAKAKAKTKKEVQQEKKAHEVGAGLFVAGLPVSQTEQ